MFFISLFGQLGKTRNTQKTTNRLRMRKGRSVVHKNLEDNYGAVIVANHEALAQVLDQVSVCYYYWVAKIIMFFGKVQCIGRSA